MIGTSLSHYRITEKLGQGGMGKVYRAEDTNLSRQVAIKVLPDEFAHDAERLGRFEREAKLLASLNHPNIAAIHGLEEHEGKRFLVLELVEGQTLSERLKKGRIPLDDTLDICRQIAEGLEAAHEKGVIHRDLKPANVKVTPEGKVKVLDFGLAKAFYEQAATADMTHSPTITDEMTRPGVVLGTAAYMSPEQARGKPVDKRADIWAFGCILYECLTGKRAFPGETVTESIAKILESEPEWALLPVDTPPSVRAVLRQCLRKDPTRRLHDIADAFIGIQELAAQPSEMVAFPRRFSLWWIAGPASVMAIATALVTIALMRRSQVAPSALVTRAIIRIEPGHWLAGIARQPEFWRPSRTAMAISHDGRFIVCSAIEGNPSPQATPRLYLRRTDQMEAKPIASIGREWRLNVYDLARGTASQLTDEGKRVHLTWTADGRRLVFNRWKSGNPNLCWQPADGSLSMERLTTSESYQSPGSMAPDGATLAFVEYHPETNADILLLDLQSRRATPLLNSRSHEAYPVFSPDGRWLAYSSDESGREEVYVRPFPNPVGKWKLPLAGGTEPLWARNGKQLFYRWQDQVWEVGVQTDTGFAPGKPHLLFEQSGYRMSVPIRCWDISPDGQRFLMVKLDDRKPQPVTELVLVQNWFEELKRFCPTGK